MERSRSAEDTGYPPVTAATGDDPTYATIEEYLHALERRQELEKAPTAALFMLGSYDMMHLQYGGHPWLTRVRCELPTRPLGPHGRSCGRLG